jgi:hypothetical protein
MCAPSIVKSTVQRGLRFKMVWAGEVAILKKTEHDTAHCGTQLVHAKREAQHQQRQPRIIAHTKTKTSSCIEYALHIAKYTSRINAESDETAA